MTPYELFVFRVGNRDLIFDHSLGFLENRPANILEIGCMRNTGIEARHGDGFSSFFFANYIKQFGGSLTICDIDPNALEVAKSAILPEFPFVKFECCPGLEVLKNRKDLSFVYLDGGDDPKEMLEEFCHCSAPLILCDDFTSKGALLRVNFPNFIRYHWRGHAHELALYGLGKGEIIMPFVQR